MLCELGALCGLKKHSLKREPSPNCHPDQSFSGRKLERKPGEERKLETLIAANSH